MASLKSLVAGSAGALLLSAAWAAEGRTAHIMIAAAEIQTDAVAAAAKAVSDARAQLRKAMASGHDIRGARGALAAAEKLLEQAKLGRGLPGETSSSVTGASAAVPAVPAAAGVPAAAAAEPLPTPEPTPPGAGVKPEMPPVGVAPAAAVGGAGEALDARAAVPASPESARHASGQPGPPIVDLSPGQEPPPPAVLDAPPPLPAIVRTDKVASGGAPAMALAPPPQPGGPIGIGDMATDGRVIRRENGQLVISHDEDSQFQASGGRVFRQRTEDGGRVVTVNRPDGSQIVTVRSPDGDVITRTRRLPDGQRVLLINTKPADQQQPIAGGGHPDPAAPIALTIPTDQYVLDAARATPQAIEETLAAPPVEEVERSYALAEVRESVRLRDKLRRINVATLEFDEGQATLREDQVGRLEGVGRAIADIIRTRPDEVFLIEGHTDAPGSDLANLALSDRRAESVAEILTYYDKVPPENLVTQGYGEQYLKVPTEDPEPANRRFTIRRITPLLRGTASE